MIPSRIKGGTGEGTAIRTDLHNIAFGRYSGLSPNEGGLLDLVEAGSCV
jgi:hypothetical protein